MKKELVDYRKRNDARDSAEPDKIEVFGEIMKKYQSTQIQFVDNSFPASSESLYIKRINDSPLCQTPAVKWLRPENIPDSDFRMKWAVTNCPAPSDVI